MSIYKGKVTVACVNFAPVIGDKAATLEKLKKFIIQASSNGANIIVFPETALTGYVFPEEMTPKLAETIPGPSTEEVAKLTGQYNVYVVFGMVERDRNHPNIFYDSAAVVAPRRVLGAYRKVHMPVDELPMCHRGNNYPIFETRYGPIGIGICYDTYCFPEVARIYATRGVRLLANVTAFPEFADVEAKDYRDFYRTTLGARSIENQMFVASANLVGVEGELSFFGYSAIFGPKLGAMNYHFWAGPAGTEEEIVMATLDLESLEHMPSPVSSIFQDRRPETYSSLMSDVKPDQ